MAVSDQNETRVIYQLVSTRTATGYCGMDEYRVCTERYKEHLSSIRDSDYTDDKKHAFMNHDIVAKWWARSMDICSLHLLAYTCAETDINTRVARNPAVPEAFEQRAVIQIRHRRSIVKKGRPVNPTHDARAAVLPRANWNNRGETPVML